MTDKPVANPAVVLREEFDDYALLYNPDEIEVFCLNPIGVRIWRQLDGRHTAEDILLDLQSTCTGVPAEAGEHLREFLGELASRGLLAPRPEQVA